MQAGGKQKDVKTLRLSRRRAKTPPILATREQAPTAWFLVFSLLLVHTVHTVILYSTYCKPESKHQRLGSQFFHYCQFLNSLTSIVILYSTYCTPESKHQLLGSQFSHYSFHSLLLVHTPYKIARKNRQAPTAWFLNSSL